MYTFHSLASEHRSTRHEHQAAPLGDAALVRRRSGLSLLCVCSLTQRGVSSLAYLRHAAQLDGVRQRMLQRCNTRQQCCWRWERAPTVSGPARSQGWVSTSSPCASLCVILLRSTSTHAAELTQKEGTPASSGISCVPHQRRGSAISGHISGGGLQPARGGQLSAWGGHLEGTLNTGLRHAHSRHDCLSRDRGPAHAAMHSLPAKPSGLP